MSLVEMVCTLGGAFTLGAGGVPGFAVGTLGDQFLFVDRLQRGRSVVTIGAFVSPAQCSMVSWRDLMDCVWESTVDDGVFLSAAVICFAPCSTFSSGITEGRVSL